VEALEDSGDKQAAATANYHKSLQFNPNNFHALERLKELEGSVK
jgi:hypothetical protein